jgi:SAM-dependent methyltransferase
MAPKTYTTMQGGLKGFVRDATRLYKVRTKDVAGEVRATIEQKGTLEREYLTSTGTPLVGKDVMVLGVGQTSREVIGFGVANRVTAIDLDVIPQGWKPGPYIRLLKQNGPVRAAKTVGRKVLGIDRRFRQALCQELGVTRAAPATYLQMDASKMSFPDATFDLVYSFSVFEHLPDPKAVLREAIRVLRPGGLASISLHLYTSEGGCHDLRIFAGDRSSIPYWAQLRPPVKDTVIESCYMNEWRLAQWHELFDELCPTGILSLDRHHEPFGSELVTELAALRAGGELGDYSDEELLGVNYRILWRKPL